jgi:hypothetical protein
MLAAVAGVNATKITKAIFSKFTETLATTVRSVADGATAVATAVGTAGADVATTVGQAVGRALTRLLPKTDPDKP